jgi:dephospho-CoA kinase
MLIGLTGGIASGKSIVADMFKSLGAYIIDSDKISREVMAPYTASYKKVVKVFGKGILNHDQTIDRKKLSSVVFGNPEKLSLLNECTHPEIYKEINRKAEIIKEKHPDALIIVDVPLLIETKAQKIFDKIIVVYADEDTQLKRLKERNGFSPTEAGKRIASQIPLKDKLKHADYVIHNDKSLEDTKRQVEKIYKKLSGLER